MVAPDIIYVEDDPDFAFLTENALENVNENLKIQIIDNGKSALEVLKNLSNIRLKPKVILLDLNLPGLSGLDLVKLIREIDFLKYTPVLFFSTSDNPKDIKASLELGANAFLNKPSGFHNLISCLHSIHDFWFNKSLHIN